MQEKYRILKTIFGHISLRNFLHLPEISTFVYFTGGIIIIIINYN